jgi:Tfp pilus assembly protein PilW
MNKKAVTLMEIIIALLLIGLTLMGLANIFVAGKRHMLHVRSRMTGGEFGKYFLEPLSQQVRQDQWGSNCVSSDGTNTNCPAPLTNPQTIGPITYTPSYAKSVVAGTTLRRVRLNLSWSEPAP